MLPKNLQMIYVPCAHAEEAHNIAKSLVVERLAACANILPPATSLSMWVGKLETASETIVVLKTRPELAQAAMKRIKALHSYECPAILTWEALSGDQRYLEWLADNTIDRF